MTQMVEQTAQARPGALPSEGVTALVADGQVQDSALFLLEQAAAGQLRGWFERYLAQSQATINVSREQALQALRGHPGYRDLSLQSKAQFITDLQGSPQVLASMAASIIPTESPPSATQKIMRALKDAQSAERPALYRPNLALSRDPQTGQVHEFLTPEGLTDLNALLRLGNIDRIPVVVEQEHVTLLQAEIVRGGAGAPVALISNDLTLAEADAVSGLFKPGQFVRIDSEGETVVNQTASPMVGMAKVNRTLYQILGKETVKSLSKEETKQLSLFYDNLKLSYDDMAALYNAEQKLPADKQHNGASFGLSLAVTVGNKINAQLGDTATRFPDTLKYYFDFLSKVATQQPNKIKQVKSTIIEALAKQLETKTEMVWGIYEISLDAERSPQTGENLDVVNIVLNVDSAFRQVDGTTFTPGEGKILRELVHNKKIPPQYNDAMPTLLAKLQLRDSELEQYVSVVQIFTQAFNDESFEGYPEHGWDAQMVASEFAKIYAYGMDESRFTPKQKELLILAELEQDPENRLLDHDQLLETIERDHVEKLQNIHPEWVQNNRFYPAKQETAPDANTALDLYAPLVDRQLPSNLNAAAAALQTLFARGMASPFDANEEQLLAHLGQRYTDPGNRDASISWGERILADAARAVDPAWAANIRHTAQSSAFSPYGEAIWRDALQQGGRLHPYPNIADEIVQALDIWYKAESKEGKTAQGTLQMKTKFINDKLTDLGWNRARFDQRVKQGQNAFHDSGVTEASPGRFKAAKLKAYLDQVLASIQDPEDIRRPTRRLTVAAETPLQQRARESLALLGYMNLVDDTDMDGLLQTLGLQRMTLDMPETTPSRPIPRPQLPVMDIRHYPVVNHAHRLQTPRAGDYADSLHTIGELAAQQGAQANPALIKVGSEALWRQHAENAQALLQVAWESSELLPRQDIVEFTVGATDTGVTYVSTVANRFIDELEQSIEFARGQKRQSGFWARQMLSTGQALGGARALASAEAALAQDQAGRHILALPSATDNRLAAAATLDRLAAENHLGAQDLVIWTTSPYLASQQLPEDTARILGDRFTLVTDVDQLQAPVDAGKPVLLISQDDADSLTALADITRGHKAAHAEAEVVLVAGEAQRLSTPSSGRSEAMKKLRESSDFALALSATPMKGSYLQLRGLAQVLGIPVQRAPSIHLALGDHLTLLPYHRGLPQETYPPVLLPDDPDTLARHQNMRRYVDQHPQSNEAYYFSAEQKWPAIQQTVMDRLAQGDQVIIGTKHLGRGDQRERVIETGTRWFAQQLENAGVPQEQIGVIDGQVSMANRKAVLKAFAEGEKRVLITLYNSIDGATAIDPANPPRRVPIVLADISNLEDINGLLNTVYLPEESFHNTTPPEVEIVIPYLVMPDASGPYQQTKDEHYLNNLRSARAKTLMADLGISQDRGGIGYSYRAGVENWTALVRDNNALAVQYLLSDQQFYAPQQAEQKLIALLTEAAQRQQQRGIKPVLVDMGAGLNEVVGKLVAAGAVDKASVGIDLIDITDQAFDRLVPEVNREQFVSGATQQAPALLQDRLPDDTASLVSFFVSLLGSPSEVADALRAASEVLARDGELHIVHTYRSFSADGLEALRRGLRQLGLELRQANKMRTVAGDLIYLKAVKTGAVQAEVDPALFDFKQVSE